MKRIRICMAAIAAIAALVATDAVGAQPATVVLVRHAEKAAAPAQDPALNAAGEARAAALAAALADARVGSVITTQFLRTRATAQPLATAAGVQPLTVAATPNLEAHVQMVADAVRSRPAGGVVLVVGHSNTIPAIIRALGGPSIPDLCEGEYEHLFVLQLAGAEGPRLIRGRFGAADAPGAGACHAARSP